MNVCFNSYPVEEGSWHRRQGTRYLAHTKGGAPAKLLDFDFSVENPYQMEFTDGFLRFYSGRSLVFTDPERDITNISSASPAVVTTGAAHGWLDNDTVVFEIAGPPCRAPLLCNRQFLIDVLSTTTFAIYDALTGDPIDGAELAWTAGTDNDDIVLRVLELTTPYTAGAWTDLRKVQDAVSVLLLRGATKPYVITEGGSFFVINAAVFKDGPYMDENITTTTLDPSGTSGSVTVVASSVTGINDGTGFQTTDVGRLIRIRSAPANWSGATTYAVGDLVTGSDDVVYSSLTAGNLNHDPTKDAVNWTVSTTGFVWSAMLITARASTTSVTATIQGSTLVNANATTHWRLGVFSDTTGWPTCGTLHEGRLYLSGVIANRIDGSRPGSHYDFTPTSDDGTVADNNAVSAVADAPELNKILWMDTDEQGLILGTQSGPWRVRASQNDDNIVPASINERKVLGIGSANIEAVRTERTLLFVQRHKRKVMEFGFFQELGGYHAPNLTKTAAHLTAGGIEEIRWQLEPQPMVWARRSDGVLLSIAYKRDPDEYYAAWSEHELGSGRLVESLSTGPSPDGLGANLFMVTNDPDTSVRWVEQLSDFFDDSKADWEFDFVDHSVTPCCAEVLDDESGVRLFGLWFLNGETVDPVIGGIDLGSYVVEDGAIEIPFLPALGFTLELLQSFSEDFGAFTLCFDFGQGDAEPVAITENSIMAYVGAEADVHGVTTAAALPDWQRGFVYCISTGGTTTRGLRKFELDPDSADDQQGGDELLQKNLAGIGITDLTVGSGGAFMLAGDGSSVFFPTNSSNSMILAQVRTSDLTKVDEFGIAGSSTAPSTGTRILSTRVMVPIEAGAAQHVLSASAGSVEEICLLPFNAGGFGVNTNIGNLDESATSGALLGPGNHGSSSGHAYGLGLPFRSGVLGANNDEPIGVYSFSTGGTKTRVGEFDFADVDVTWGRIFICKGLGYDTFDGHLLAMVTTDEAVTNTAYLLKISSVDGTIVWKLIMPTSGVTASDWSLSGTRIINSTYFYIAAADTVWVIDTITGTKTTVTFDGLSLPTGPQYSDDISNSIIFYGNFNPGVPPPAFLGTYMGAEANHSGTHWFRIFLGTVVGQPRRTFSNITFCVPAIVGMTYISRGQLLRPDHGSDIGAAAGPAFGKTRRIHQYGASVYRTRSISFGLGFDETPSSMFQAPLKKANGAALDPAALFSGTVIAKLESRYDYDNKIAWECRRPYPAIVTVVAGYGAAQDR